MKNHSNSLLSSRPRAGRAMSEKPSAKRRKREMPQVAVRLTVDQISDLDRIAEESAGRRNRSDLIRDAVDEYLHRRKRS